MASPRPRPMPRPLTPPPVEDAVAELLRTGAVRERAGRFEGAIRAYEFAVAMAEETDRKPELAEALRRLAVVLHLRSRSVEARVLVRRSAEVAEACGRAVLLGEALNTLASFELEAGEMGIARRTFARALAFAEDDARLRGKIEQNLGVAANIQGDHAAAFGHYHRALDAFESAGHEAGAAVAAHNLGCIARERGDFNEAARCFGWSLDLALRIGDVRLQGLCALNRAEVSLARGDYHSAREDAEAALRTFEELDAPLDKSAACRVLGMVYRETGRPVLAEARLRAATRLAVEGGWVHGQAEAARELALLHHRLGRSEDSVIQLGEALRLFGFLDARLDVMDIAAKMGAYEGIVLHCERVGAMGADVARALGLSDTAQAAIRLGAFLHDIGKIRIPQELLTREGPLTAEEIEIVKRHPTDGVELLEGAALPVEVRRIVRWHHEKFDGSGYPDGLTGAEIPIEAQVICAADVYDALTTPRAYRAPLTREEAIREMTRCRSWWHPDVFEAFLAVVRPADGPARPLPCV
ncbi:MAG: HD domain-containing phosphohydrolase [Gemmatimonadales bacterium]